MNKRTGMILVTVALAGSLLACNLPFSGSESTPTPDLTLTALFAPTGVPTFLPTGTSMAVPPTPTTVPTNTPTNTPLPTATSTATPLPSRPGPSTNAYFLTKLPILNGDWGDWKSESVEYPVKSIVYGKSNWSGSKDLQGSYMLGWDYTYLYVGVKVIDDKFVQQATGANMYKGDSVEILMDTNLQGDYNAHTLNGDDYQLGISPGQGVDKITTSGETFMWEPSSIAGSRPQVAVSSTGGSGLYRIEAAIPWAIFGITPQPGMKIGFVLSINDNDDTSANIEQSMASSDAYRVRTDPTTWGIVTLAR